MFEPQSTSFSHRRRSARWVMAPGQEATASVLQQAGVAFCDGKTEWLSFIPVLGGEYGAFILPDDHVTMVSSLHVEQQEGTSVVGPISRPEFRVGVLKLGAYRAATSHLPQLVELIAKYFHRSLCVIDLDTSPVAPVTEDVIEPLLRGFPLLECLKLSHTELTTLDVLINAYADPHSADLQVLWVDSGHVSFFPLFEVLADEHSTASKTLRELRLHFTVDDGAEDSNDAYLLSIRKALELNKTLEFLELVVVAYGGQGRIVERVKCTLCPFHRELLPIRRRVNGAVPLKCQLAFLSACSMRFGRIDSYVATRVFDFAALCERRLIRLVQETDRHAAHFKTCCLTSGFKSAIEEQVNLLVSCWRYF